MSEERRSGHREMKEGRECVGESPLRRYLRGTLEQAVKDVYAKGKQTHIYIP